MLMSRPSRHRRLSNEDLGDKGEVVFRGLCIDTDLTASKSDPDRMGWDFLVEDRYPDPDIATPLDKRPHPIECKVQVKTIWSDNKEISLTLSAAERLAKSNLPSFVFALSIDADLNLVAMHCFHLLDGHLEHVLKRLRKATADNSLKINHTQISLSLRKGVSISPDGASLRQFIMDACGASADEYHRKKNDQMANLGFSGPRYSGNFKIQAKSELEVAELFLGLRPAKLSTFEASEIRFGIKLPHFAATTGIISITPSPVAACKIIIKGRDGAGSISISGALYLPPHRNTNGEIPFRISTSLFEVLVIGKNLEIDNKGEVFAKTPVELKELLATLKFHSLLARGGGHLTIAAGNKQIMSGEFDTSADKDVFESTDARIRLVKMAVAVFKAADALSRQVSFSSLVDSSIDLMFLSELIGNEEGVKVNPMTFRPEVEFELPRVSEALLIKRLRFDDFAIAYYAVMDVTLTDQSPDVMLEVRSLSLRDVTNIRDENDAFDAYVEEARLITGIEMTLVMNRS